MPRKLRHILTKEEAAKLLSVPNPRCITGLRNRTMLEVMYRGGLRVGEVVNLRPGHIRWDTGEIEIHNGKGGAERVVPLAADSMDWLYRWNEKRPKGSRHFFCTFKGAALSTRYLDQMVKRFANAAGIQEVEVRDGRPHYKIHCHSLRHSYATEKLAEGFTLAEVRDLLGHTSIKTTSEYLHSDPVALREKVQKQKVRDQIRELEEQLAVLKQQASE